MIFSYIALANASTPFSQYGMIQNVQDYSASPFYNSSNYAPSAPKLVYSSGPALKPSDCERTVKALVENACAQRNNCKNAKLADIRPNIMVNLSTLPGYNYASSCSGYIDTIFEEYKKQNNTTTIQNINIPTNAIPSAQTQLSNLPQWKQEYNERAAELKALQSETDSITNSISKTDFPKTFNDLSFAERNQILAQGYKPYKDAHVYEPIKIPAKEREEGMYTTTEVLKKQQTSLRTCITNYQEQYNKTQKALAKATNYLNYLENDLIPWAEAVVDKWNGMTPEEQDALSAADKAKYNKAKMILVLKNPSAPESASNPKKIVKDARDAISTADKANKTARTNAINSPCLCTKTMEERFRTNFLNKLHVKCGTNNEVIP